VFACHGRSLNSYLAAPGNPRVGRISSIRCRNGDGYDGADQSAVIHINLRTSSSPSVGARVVGSGWESLDGRPIGITLSREVRQEAR